MMLKNQAKMYKNSLDFRDTYTFSQMIYFGYGAYFIVMFSLPTPKYGSFLENCMALNCFIIFSRSY